MEKGENTKKKNGKKSFVRRFLMLFGILAVLGGGAYIYLGSGRYIGTDNAYIKAAKILITPQVSGTITAVNIVDNQQVKEGDLLFTIDPASYAIAVDDAKAEVAKAYADIKQLKAQYGQKQEDLARAQVEVDYATKEYDRRVALVAKGTVAQSEFSEVKRQRDAAVKSVDAIAEEIKGILAALDGNPDIRPEDHPHYQKAMAQLHEAELNLERTEVTSPADGVVGTAPHVGDYARAGVPMLNLVGTGHVWIEANYKETELTDVRPGQPVTIEVDTYPGREWKGRVDSISPATASEFSILPAQNASGNWVKVVQRIGVRIDVDPQQSAPLLRAGMSTHVTIDTGTYPHALNWGKAVAAVNPQDE